PLQMAVLDGGWQAWVAANHPARPRAESRLPTTFVGHPRSGMIRNADEVGELARSSSWVVVDSRALTRASAQTACNKSCHCRNFGVCCASPTKSFCRNRASTGYAMMNIGSLQE
ncbi:MAG: hypothetical protein AAB385_03740, partial [Planctomycetota bacterium]